MPLPQVDHRTDYSRLHPPIEDQRARRTDLLLGLALGLIVGGAAVVLYFVFAGGGL